MKITIITACRRVNGLKKVIKSIDAQTYTDWQHIIVNDNHPEVREFLKTLPESPKRYWIDLGVRTHWYGGIARNIGAMAAFSYIKDSNREWDDSWLIFLDDDNLWYPNHLETLVKGHKEKPEATLIGVDMEIRGCINKDYKHILKCQIKPQQCDLGNFIYKKDLFEKYGYFRPRPRHKISFDYELISKIAEGEGEEKIHIISGKHTFVFYHKER